MEVFEEEIKKGRLLVSFDLMPVEGCLLVVPKPLMVYLV